MEYQLILEDLEIPFKVDDYYLRVGEPKRNFGWILHLSILSSQAADLLYNILPLLNCSNLPFKVVKNDKLVDAVNNGVFGSFKIGKIVTVFMDNDDTGPELVKQLVEISKSSLGPKVLTDLPISGIISARFGSFRREVGIDPFGNYVRIIRDDSGTEYVDEYILPPYQPTNVFNPFSDVIKRNKYKTRFLYHRWLTMSLLKDDIKGRVWRGVYIDKRYLFHDCVIKQGKKGMYIDDQGRDISERIEWQYSIWNDLRKFVAAPKCFAITEDDEQAFIVTKFIKGTKSLRKFVQLESDGVCWRKLSSPQRQKLLCIVLQLTKSINIIHHNGYIHRDITASNFIIDRKNKIWLIDFELMYSFKNNLPNKPFQLGTYGYMSPQQIAGDTPATSDDCYSIGALLTMITSGGIEPNLIIDSNEKDTKSRIRFFCDDPEIESLIYECISEDPSKRPTSDSIVNRIKLLIKADSKRKTEAVTHPSNDQISSCINNGIQMLGSDCLSLNNLWYSKVEKDFDWEVYPQIDKHIFGGLHRGVGGVIYLLGQLKNNKFDISSTSSHIESAINFLEKNILTRLNHWAPSMYFGNAGFVVAISNAIYNGFLCYTKHLEESIHVGLKTPSSENNIVYGIAGQILSAIACQEKLNMPSLDNIIINYVGLLLEHQNLDGSWNESSGKINGFSYGIAGIAYTLLVYGEKKNDHISINAACKALRYLTKVSLKGKATLDWMNSDRIETVKKWWCHGSPGISLAFLKGYQITKEPEYKGIAEMALRSNPSNLISPNLSQCHGLAGLGEIYLEAQRVTGSQEWQDRAGWIANLIMNLQRKDNRSIYWLVENAKFPTADFMIGSSGVVHFLLRYLFPENISIPFMPK